MVVGNKKGKSKNRKDKRKAKCFDCQKDRLSNKVKFIESEGGGDETSINSKLNKEVHEKRNRTKRGEDVRSKIYSPNKGSSITQTVKSTPTEGNNLCMKHKCTEDKHFFSFRAKCRYNL